MSAFQHELQKEEWSSPVSFVHQEFFDFTLYYHYPGNAIDHFNFGKHFNTSAIFQIL